MTITISGFSHLRTLTDEGGLYEHAEGIVPRKEHGYCVDDVARGLVVVCREAHLTGQLDDLFSDYFRFLLSAQTQDGRVQNRRSARLEWSGPASTEDCWGRALWAFGAAAATSAVPAHWREQSAAAFRRGAAWRSPWPRAMAFAALGAAELLSHDPGDVVAEALLQEAADTLLSLPQSDLWGWPEDRLTYANALIPEVLIAAGAVLQQPLVAAEGLRMLDWLRERWTAAGRLSVSGAAGEGPQDHGVHFDQQPIEVAAFADACARAYAYSGDHEWADGVDLAALWFLGTNDSGVSMVDPVSGGGCDGLEPHGRNENQGAESTLAMLSTLQQARWLERPRP